uniref:Uncharacterized protein n=1 Tax=Rhizophora mucronata TaxID=61149 RepID=A0A2P2IJN9_RHIMU
MAFSSLIFYLSSYLLCFQNLILFFRFPPPPQTFKCRND